MGEHLYEGILTDENESLPSHTDVKGLTMSTNDRISEMESGSLGYTDVRNSYHGSLGAPIPQSPSTIQLLPHVHAKYSQRPTLHIPPCQGSFDSVDSTSSDRTSKSDSCNSDSARKSTSKCSFLFTIFVVLLFVVMASALGYLFYTVLNLQTKYDTLQQELHNVKNTQAFTEEEPRLCLPCDELSQGPLVEYNPDFDDLITREENGRSICCAKTTAQTSVLLNLFAKRKQLEKCAHELLTDNRTNAPCNHTCITGTTGPTPPRPTAGAISAHLLVGVQPDKTDSDPHASQPIRNWQHDKPGTHLTGIQIVDDRLFVPETGLYFLYSQVSFLVYYEDNKEPDQNGAQSLFHSVYRYNVIYPLGNEELLRSGVTQCWERQKDYGRYTNYVGASLHLNKGDQIYIDVTKIQFLSREAPLTYFGMFKLG